MPEQTTLDFKSPNDSARAAVVYKRARLHMPHFLRDDEFNSIVSASHKNVECATSRRWKLRAIRDRLMLHLGLYCGLRVAELCRLRIEHIDLKGAMLNVIQGKGGRDRSIPIADKLLVLLKEWIGPCNYGWLLHGECGWHVGTRTVQERLKILAKQAVITRIKMRPHVLRHTFASRLLKSGATIYEVKELLGHRSLASTICYLHAEPAHLKTAVDRL